MVILSLPLKLQQYEAGAAIAFLPPRKENPAAKVANPEEWELRSGGEKLIPGVAT